MSPSYLQFPNTSFMQIKKSDLFLSRRVQNEMAVFLQLIQKKQESVESLEDVFSLEHALPRDHLHNIGTQESLVWNLFFMATKEVERTHRKGCFCLR